MRLFTVFAFTIISVFSFAQSNQIQISAYEYANLIEPLNIQNASKIANSLYFERKIISNLSLVGGFTYSKMKIEDTCNGCGDAFHGTGDFKESAFSIGVKSYFEKLSIKRLKPFLQYDLYYGQSTYSGEFGGGIAGQGTTVDEKYNKIGLIGRAGIDIHLSKNITFTPLTSLRFTYIENRTIQSPTSTGQSINEISAWIPIDLRIGYRF